VSAQINQPSRCRAALERLPAAQLERFAAGHAPFLETPEAFMQSLESFLAAVELRTPAATLALPLAPAFASPANV
jgi:hypothetical protein